MKLSLIESRLFGRICYGFKRDKYGFAEIVPEQAEVVKTIFRMYREENSLEDIQKHLLSRSISSPSGKVKWSRDVLNKLLNNGKRHCKAGGYSRSQQHRYNTYLHHVHRRRTPP